MFQSQFPFNDNKVLTYFVFDVENKVCEWQLC